MAVLDQASNLLPSASLVQGAASLLVQITVIAVVGYLGYRAWIWYQHKHRVIVHKQFGDDKKQYSFDKARIVDNEGDTEWHLRGMDRNVQAPPSKALEPSTDGTMVAHAALDSDGGWTWIRSEYQFHEDQSVDADGAGTDEMSEVAKPSRASLKRQTKRNQEIRGRSWWDDNASMIVGLIAICAVVLVNAYAGQMLLGSVQEITVEVGNVVEQLEQVSQSLDGVANNETRIPVNQTTGGPS
jgi:hypothetical protein